MEMDVTPGWRWLSVGDLDENFSSLSLPCPISHSFCCFSLFCVSFDEKLPLYLTQKNDICAGISTGWISWGQKNRFPGDTFLVGLR